VGGVRSRDEGGGGVVASLMMTGGERESESES
jgi:hypothetical protein